MKVLVDQTRKEHLRLEMSFMVKVRSPRAAFTSLKEPTARIRLPATATAVASGLLCSMVRIFFAV